MTVSAERVTSAVGQATLGTGHLPKFKLGFRSLMQTADLIAATVSAALGAVVLVALSPHRAGHLDARHVALTALAMVAALHVHSQYHRPASRLRPSGWWRPAVIARCLPTAVLLTLAADALISRGERMTLTAAVAMTLLAGVLVPLGRRMLLRMADPAVTRILVIGTGTVTDRLTSRLGRCPDTLVVGHIDDNTGPDRPVLGGLCDIARICAAFEIDRIIVGFPNASDATVLEALRKLGGRVPVSEIPRYFELHNWRSEAEELQGLTLMHLPAASLALHSQAIKRVMDLTLGALALAFASPVLIAIALAIKADSRGPIFFRQERTGRAGEPFRIFKFRSMTADAWEQRDAVAGLNQSDGPLFKMEHDPRVTRVGALIRKTSLDELPQLINVVRGEMSLVGPRPLPTEESNQLDGAALARLDVRPGITGLWQVCGRSDLTYADLQHLDSVYVRSWTLLWDLRIIAQTPRTVFAHHGAY